MRIVAGELQFHSVFTIMQGGTPVLTRQNHLRPYFIALNPCFLWRWRGQHSSLCSCTNRTTHKAKSKASNQAENYLPRCYFVSSQIQLGHVLLTSVVDAKTARHGRLAVYVGHLVEFDSIARDISSNSRGRQLALIGQDLIAHSRVVLSCRSKRLFFAPLEANDVWAGQIV